MTTTRSTIEERDVARFANLGGFTFLIVHGVTFALAGLASFVLELETAALVYLFQGLVAFPLSLALERAQGFRLLGKENSLTPLFIQVASIQIVALPAVIYVFDLDPRLVPAAFAAVAGAHFLPYVWLQHTRIYGALAVFMALVPWGLLLVLGRDAAFHATGPVAGAALIVAGVAVRSVVLRDRLAAA
jgi:hypothetical protein